MSRPTVDVVILTAGQRPRLLDQALSGVAAQDADAAVRTVVWIDAHSPQALPAPPDGADGWVRVEDRATLPTETPLRIAALRDLAVRTSSADYIAFLDDDNVWAPDHLSGLLELARAGTPAVHSWRLLVGADGGALVVDEFPWLPPGPQADVRFRELVAAGVMNRDNAEVRDSARFTLPDGRVEGMVDMGEWLLHRSLFDRSPFGVLDFRAPRTAAQLAERYGEDDLILAQLLRLDVPIRCTGRATLHYRLGGVSNLEHAERAGR